jgi:energy-coupling factor transporter ATP-binding protein EcfA2
MGHVERVKISGFKCLSAVDLECGQFNLVTGQNGTGKTSILEAIQLAHDPGSLEKYRERPAKVINIDSERAEIQIGLKGDVLSVEIGEVGQQTAVSAVAEAIQEGTVVVRENEAVRKRSSATPLSEYDSGLLGRIEREVEAFASELSDRVVSVATKGGTDTYVASPRHLVRPVVDSLDDIDALSEAERLSFSPKATAEFSNRPSQVEPVLFVSPSDRRRHPHPSRGNETRQVRVRDFLREHAILPNIESFSFDELVFEQDGEQHSIPYDFLGEGTKTVISLIWELLSEGEIPDVILLEEPENHLHPGYVKELVEFLIEFAREEDIQLFVTTHNVDFLREFFNDATVGDHKTWLEEEFQLIQTTELSPKQFDYERAREHVEELQLDLRGL